MFVGGGGGGGGTMEGSGYYEESNEGVLPITRIDP